MSEALQKAVDFFGGNKSALARAVGVKPMTVGQWFSRGIPAERVVQIEEATHGAVTRDQLRPDLYTATKDITAA